MIYPNSQTGDPGTNKTAYTYTEAGRLKQRTWARGIVTDYQYDFDFANSVRKAGDLMQISYSNTNTPTITYEYDRRGRLKVATQKLADNTVTNQCALDYNDAGEPVAETYVEGPLKNLVVTNLYDSVLRRQENSPRVAGSTNILKNTSIYGNDGRLKQIDDGTYAVGYQYLANSPLAGDADCP